MATLPTDLDPLVRERWLRLPPFYGTLSTKHTFLLVITCLACSCVSFECMVKTGKGANERFQTVRVLTVAYIWRLMQFILGQDKVPPLYYLRNVLPIYDLPITVVFAAFCYVLPVIAKSPEASLLLHACFLLWIVYEKLKQYISPTPASSSITKLLHQQNNDAANNSISSNPWETLHAFHIPLIDHFTVILLAALCVDLGVQIESLHGTGALECWSLLLLIKIMSCPMPSPVGVKFEGLSDQHPRKVILSYHLPITAAITAFYGIVRTFPKVLLLASSMDLISLALGQCETQVFTGAAEVGAVSSLNTGLVHQHNYAAPHLVSSASNFIFDDPSGGGGSLSFHVASSRDPAVSFVAAQLGDRPLRECPLRLLMPSTAELVSHFGLVICFAPMVLAKTPKEAHKLLELFPELMGFAAVQLSKCLHVRWAKHGRPHGYCPRQVERLYGMTFTAIIILSIVLRWRSESLFVAYGLVLHLLFLIISTLDVSVSLTEGGEVEQNISRTPASSVKTEFRDQQNYDVAASACVAQWHHSRLLAAFNRVRSLLARSTCLLQKEEEKNYDVAHSISSATNFGQREREDPAGAAEAGSVSSNIDQHNYDDPQSFSSPSNFRKRPKRDPPTGAGGFASVRAASSIVLSPIQEEEDDDDANSTSNADNFSRWKKGKIIGAGGFGTVYLAYNRKTEKLCAVKELKDIFKPENVASIKKEIEILSKLKHSNIVKYYDNEIVGHRICLYMEYIQPGSLKKYISEQGVLNEHLIQNFTAQILSGLIYLRSKRVVHRYVPHACMEYARHCNTHIL
ncbi:uncharacterized protein LOC114713651 [Neltuma alba]|uniref:uncharacterized protein LOC114713651 n=1 Tax=Neltuma alba TaxID=207710 RepID=UPI0010A4876C|nr:uncharacterized protein LOC114713651 [Prosopis alba]